MRLRRECEHGRYDGHEMPRDLDCPGGVFLPDDTIVIENVDGQWPEPLRRFAEWVIQYTAESSVWETE